MKLHRIVLWAMLMVAWMTGAVRAQALVERVPADALVYVGWEGADRLRAAYDGSHLKAVVDATSWQEFVQKQLPTLIERAENGEEARMIQEALGVGGVMWRYPTAVYVGRVEFGGQRPPMPRLAVLCDAGADVPQVADRIGRLIAGVQGGPVQVQVKTAGTVVALIVGDLGAGEAVLLGTNAQGILAQDASFQAAVAQVQKHAALTAYVDIAGLVEIGNQVASKGRDNPWPQIRDALGLPGVQSAVFTAGFEGKDWGTQLFISMPGAQGGAMGLVEALPVTDAQLKVVPAGATWMSAGRCDLGRVVDVVMGALQKSSPRDYAMTTRWLEQLNQQIGVDLRKDLLGSLGDECTSYTAPTVGGSGLFGATMVWSVKDPAKLAASLEKVESYVNRSLDRAMNGPSQPKIRITRSPMGGMTVSYVPLFILTPGWAVQDGRLYISATAQAIPGAVEAASGKNSILSDEKFLAVRKRLGVQNALSISYTDLPSTAVEGYPLLAQVLSIVSTMAGEEAPPTLLPSLNKLLPELAPAGSASWRDAVGWHYKSISPMPGTCVLRGQQTAGMSMPAMMVAILLPSLGKARELSNRSVEAANLRGIGQSCAIYGADNADQMPEHLAVLVARGDISPKSLVTKRSQTEPAMLTPDQMAAASKDWHAIEKVIDEHCDVVYLGKGTKNTADASLVMAFIDPRKVDVSQGMNMVFGDGHVEWIRPGQIRSALEPTLKQRKEAGLSVEAIDELLKAVGEGGSPGGMP